MGSSVKLSLAAALLSAPAPALATAPTMLAPLKPWNLHYAENRCQLIRTFGDSAKPTTMVLERIGPSPLKSLLVFGGELRARVGSGKARAAFLPFPKHVFETDKVAETTDTKQPAIMWTNVNLLPGWEAPPPPRSGERPRNEPAQVEALRSLENRAAAEVAGLQIIEPFGRRVILQTGSLKRAMDMMRECGREQLAAWGLDPAVGDKIVLPAFGVQPMTKLFSSSDYPALALRSGSEAIVSARLNIGTVTRCTSLTPFREPAFAEVVCRNLSKAKFLPAELADGTRVPDYVVTNVVFRLP